VFWDFEKAFDDDQRTEKKDRFVCRMMEIVVNQVSF